MIRILRHSAAAASCHSRCVETLARVALAVLPQMVDRATGLFARKTLVSDAGEYLNSEPSLLYSATTLVGILAADRSGQARSLSETVSGCLDALHRQGMESRDAAMLAALVWASTLADDQRLERALDRLDSVLDPGTASSMQLGLALTAVSSAAGRLPDPRGRLPRRAAHLARELCNRFDSSGDVFAAQAKRRRPRDVAMSRMTSFASQVYPIHGLSEATRLLGSRPPKEIALVCNRLCEAQGPLGQWWWFYNLKRHAVVEPYPVYSVHQDAMAFMALAAAQRIGEGRYGEHLARGLEWVYGRNELQTPLVTETPPFIFRAIQRSGGAADSLAGWSRRQRYRAVRRSWIPYPANCGSSSRDLEILRECRSYHLGWILYVAASLPASAAHVDDVLPG